MNRIKKASIFLSIWCLLLPSIAFAQDPLYSQQWYLDTIKAPEAWAITKGSADIVVAVIDTGVDLDHPDLKDNLWVNADEVDADLLDNDNNGYVDDRYGWNFVSGKNIPSPKISAVYSSVAVSHGTFVSGIISAIHDNNQGIKGVTANVKIMPLAALDANGYGGSDEVTSAINYAVANGAQIINLSFGGYEHSAALKKSIINAYDSGVLIVAAAGNAESGAYEGKDMTNAPQYPICYDQDFDVNRILGVSATGKNNKLALFSNYGRDCVDIAAPGDDLVGLVYQDGASFPYYYEAGWNGTSFAAAMVSGAAALLKSVDKSLTPAQLIDVLIKESGILFIDQNKHVNKIGSGILNIKKAMDKIYVPAAAPSAPTTAAPPPPTSNKAEIIVSAKSQGAGAVKIFNSQWQEINEIEIFKGEKFKGLNLYSADVNADAAKEIIVGAAKGSQPFVRVVDLDGKILSSFLAFDAKFSAGVEVAAGDVDDDGSVEILAAPESGWSPVVRIFDLNGKLEKEFLAFNETFKNGLNLAVADLDNDKKLEIIAAPHQGLMPTVKIFDAAGNLKKRFNAFAPQFTGGVNIAAGDINSDGQDDLIVGAGVGGGPHVQAFNWKGEKLTSFMAYTTNFKGGVEVAAVDWDGDGAKEIVTAAGPGGGPHARVFNRFGSLLSEVFVYPSEFTAGVNICAN